MRSSLERFLSLVRYSDSELAEISLGILMVVISVVPDGVHWVGLAARVILVILGFARCWASLQCGLAVRHGMNIGSVLLFGSLLASEWFHPERGDELFLASVTGVATWCLYRTGFELSSRINSDVRK
jgi:hypothetical protein